MQKKSQPIVYLHVWSGQAAHAESLIRARFPGSKIVAVSHRELRAAGMRGQLRCLRQLKGRALVYFFDEMEGQPQLQLLLWSGLVHRCRETVLADATGRVAAYRRPDLLLAVPRTLLSALLDAAIFCFSWVALNLLRAVLEPVPLGGALPQAKLDVAYLFPYPLNRTGVGGAMSHVHGFLNGLAESSARCEVFSGCPLPTKQFPVSVVPIQRRFFLFWESLMLSYSLRFARSVAAQIDDRGAMALYQRHGRFVVTGALLAFWRRIPLVLEYNSSEVWLAENWDPSRFRLWLRLCEDVSLSAASLIVVVSAPLREELIRRGIPRERILVNPNAVNPSVFRPDCGGSSVRRQLDFAPSHVVVGFLGTFGYWHGVEVLRDAIQQLFRDTDPHDETNRLRFLLVGDGLLRPDMSKALQPLQEAGRVVFTGPLPHELVPSYLDACDILVSPHVPMRDGRPFFGSPTKLFEYMAMGKAIVASRLDQLEQVLEHKKTACLVAPGDARELADSIELLAADPELRRQLGANVRSVAIEQHTWRGNAARFLARIRASAQAPAAEPAREIPHWEEKPVSCVASRMDES
jgi:glycosyltransferase involved in cell wall biosynthesis